MDSGFQLHRYSEKVWIAQGVSGLGGELTKSLTECENSMVSGLREWVAGDDSLLLEYDRVVGEREVRELLRVCGGVTEGGDVHEVPVCFDGPDLEEVAELFSVSVEDLISRFCAGEYEVKFMGFSPGFGYLTGGEVSGVPRRKRPRERMRAGTVAVAAGYACIYPVESPGGWNWLGHTEVRPFDLEREEAFLFAPGDTVKFYQV